jgi:hypothetical protein
VFAVIVFPGLIRLSVFPIYVLIEMSHPTKVMAAVFSLLALLIALIFPQLQILKSLAMFSGSGTVVDHLSLSQYGAMCMNDAEHSFIGLDMTLVKICPYVELMQFAFQVISFFSVFLLIASFLNILLSENVGQMSEK